MVESHISMSLFSKERRSMMGSMFDGMEIVVAVENRNSLGHNYRYVSVDGSETTVNSHRIM